MTIKVYNILKKNFKKAKELSLFLDCDLVSKKPSVDSYIEVSEEGLIFVSNTNKTKKYLHIDFTKGSMAWRLSRFEHETLLKKALGRNKDQIKIFDATAGLLQDSLVFLSLGHRVVACEQSKILYSLLTDACERARSKIKTLKNLTLINGEASEVFKTFADFTVIYLDPMYPDKKKSALRSGSISIIKEILLLENIKDQGNHLFNFFKKTRSRKIILKRPIKSEKLCNNINYQVSGKSTRFDIYI